jgi:hypothetical protein
MSDFRNAVDSFLSKNKTLEGIPEWKETARDREMLWFWLLAYENGETTQHRLLIQAQPFTPWAGYCVSVQYYHMERHYPVVRLNVDTDQHEHVNRFARPPGVPSSVSGNRVYVWEDNRLTFTPDMLGLPYARPLAPKNINFENAIRYMCGMANIKPYGEALPVYPRPTSLV